MSADSMKILISHALNDPVFQQKLIQDPNTAIVSPHGLNIGAADFTAPEMTAIGKLNKADFDSIKDIKAKLNPMAHEVTGGVIL